MNLFLYSLERIPQPLVTIAYVAGRTFKSGITLRFQLTSVNDKF